MNPPRPPAAHRIPRDAARSPSRPGWMPVGRAAQRHQVGIRPVSEPLAALNERFAEAQVRDGAAEQVSPSRKKTKKTSPTEPGGRCSPPEDGDSVITTILSHGRVPPSPSRRRRRLPTGATNQSWPVTGGIIAESRLIVARFINVLQRRRAEQRGNRRLILKGRVDGR